MDKKVANKYSYSKGIRNNISQVFGKNKWLWLLPFTGDSGKPIGDGVVWNSPLSIEIDEIPDEESEKKQATSKHFHEENKGKDTNTAPDSMGNRTESTKVFYHPEAKSNSGRIEVKVTEDLILSPEP